MTEPKKCVVCGSAPKESTNDAPRWFQLYCQGRTGVGYHEILAYAYVSRRLAVKRWNSLNDRRSRSAIKRQKRTDNRPDGGLLTRPRKPKR